jgi:hypothetical protein
VTLDWKQLDPSLAVGFYFQNRTEFNDFCNETRFKNEAKKARNQTFLYQVEHIAPSYLVADTSSPATSPIPSMKLNPNTMDLHLEGEGKGSNSNKSSEKKNSQSLGIAIDDADFDETKNADDDDDEYIFL